jgi:hypothetical protein
MIDNLKVYILDILSILLPGGLVMVVLSHVCPLNDAFLSVFPDRKEEWINVVVYMGAAYILGHFIFFIGSFLDGWIFENVKKVFWNDHRLTAYVLALKKAKTGIDDRDILNAFKWSCAWLLANRPGMYGVVERHIAESKFFRSLIVVLAIALAAYLVQRDILLSTFCMLLIVFCLIRYLTQRQKSIDTAYEFIITTADKTFHEPDGSILAMLRANNIDPCARPNHKLKKKSIRCTIRKVFAVLNLLFNPFYGKKEI